MKIKIGHLRSIIAEEVRAAADARALEELDMSDVKDAWRKTKKAVGSAVDTTRRSVAEKMSPAVVSAIKDLAKYLAEWDFYLKGSHAAITRGQYSYYDDVKSAGKGALAMLGRPDGPNDESAVTSKTEEFTEKLLNFYKSEGGVPAFSEKGWRQNYKWTPDFTKPDEIKNMAAQCRAEWNAEQKRATTFEKAVMSGDKNELAKLEADEKKLPYHVKMLLH